jgi:putative nucleotidyltransferase with HDIG domain
MIVKSISVNDLRAGMILYADTVNSRNEVIVPRNTVLSQRHLARFMASGVKEITVMIPDYIATPEEIREFEPKENPLKSTEEYKEFRKSILAIANKLSESFEKILEDPALPIEASPMIAAVNDVSEKSGSTLHLLELLQCSRDFEDSIFVHSVSVALISRIIGIKAGFNDTQMSDIILCSLYHDIGKLQIPEEILNKPEPLLDEERETIKTHTTLGYSTLVRTSLPEYVALCALHHHEHYDGTGYPAGLKGQKIPLYARYVAVADVYNAMTSKRPYRNEICPFNVIDGFEKEGLQQFDPAALFPFLSCLAQSMIGATVLLSDGSMGKIILLNDRFTKPIVQVSTGFVDLVKRPDLEIKKII